MARSLLAEKLLAREAWHDSAGYVFTDALGKPYSPDFVSERFEQLLQAAGLPRLRFHDRDT